MHRFSSLFPLLLSLVLAACANVGGQGKADDAGTPVVRTPSPLDAGLAYYSHVRTLGAADWARENDALKDAVAKTPSELVRLRQILLLLAPAAPLREHSRAAFLLERLDKDAQKSASPLLPLITLLRGELDERKRLEDKLRDESRKSDELEQKLEAQKATEKDLLQKLEALKAIEKNLLDRRRVPQAVSKP